MRLSTIWTLCSLMSCIARPIEDKLMTLLKGMNDEQLTALEERLANLLQKDDDQMQGDMPFPVNESDSIRAAKESWEVLGERDRKQRLDMIKQNVLMFANRSPNSTTNGTVITPHAKDEIMKKTIQELLSEWKQSSRTDKEQIFYPTCELPRNTDEETWQGSQALNLYFDLPFSSVSIGGPIVQFQSAFLKLYKLSQGNTTIQITEDCSNNPNNCEMDGKKYIYSPNGGSLLQDDKQIRVSVYWYTRSVKKHRIKKKLLDSKMMPVVGEEWTEFNIKPAVNAWRENGRNFGLTVEVEDEDRVILNALKYFEQMNCSLDGSVSNSPLSDSRSWKFPVIYLKMIEFQENHSVYQSVKYPLVENSHRVRHHHVTSPQQQSNRPQPSEETPANDSIESIRWGDPSSLK